LPRLARGSLFRVEGMMDNGMWEEPVTFETSKLGKYWTVTSTAEAARALMERWPLAAGAAYEAALQTCLAVM